MNSLTVEDYCSRLMRTYQYSISIPRYLVNMDQTAIYLNCSPNCTVDRKEKRTIRYASVFLPQYSLHYVCQLLWTVRNCHCLLFLRATPMAILRNNFPVSCLPVCLVAQEARHGVTSVLCLNGMIRFGSLTFLAMTVSLDCYWVITRST